MLFTSFYACVLDEETMQAWAGPRKTFDTRAGHHIRSRIGGNGNCGRYDPQSYFMNPAIKTRFYKLHQECLDKKKIEDVIQRREDQEKQEK
ncbi:hypothetical protein RMCBS344292_09983 [Rhizopus microsporus]|nr:hypothetical protein RMCBS344292_09983 [Rhizopus microsporus]